jgi:hypothetical protein
MLHYFSEDCSPLTFSGHYNPNVVSVGLADVLALRIARNKEA